MRSHSFLLVLIFMPVAFSYSGSTLLSMISTPVKNAVKRTEGSAIW